MLCIRVADSPYRAVRRTKPLNVQVAPLASAGQRAAAVVFISAQEYQTVPASSVLQDLLNLTPAEARVTAALVSGKTIKQFAEETEVTLNTVRTHLKSVFSKTGVSRQSDLVRLRCDPYQVRASEAQHRCPEAARNARRFSSSGFNYVDNPTPCRPRLQLGRVA